MAVSRAIVVVLVLYLRSHWAGEEGARESSWVLVRGTTGRDQSMGAGLILAERQRSSTSTSTRQWYFEQEEEGTVVLVRASNAYPHHSLGCLL